VNYPAPKEGGASVPIRSAVLRKIPKNPKIIMEGNGSIRYGWEPVKEGEVPVPVGMVEVDSGPDEDPWSSAGEG